MTFRWNMSSWRRRQWAVVVAMVVLITLTPLAWIQWQQARMIEDVSRHQFESMMWQAYQLGYELNRLDDSLQKASVPGSTVSGADLLERYEVFFSRIQLVTDMPRKDLLEASSTFAGATEQVKAFTALADPLFEQSDTLPTNAAALQALRESAERLKPALHALTQESNRAVARFVDERNLQLRQQSILVIVLSTVQAGLLMVLVAALVRHVRRQKQENSKLKEIGRAHV